MHQEEEKKDMDASQISESDGYNMENREFNELAYQYYQVSFQDKFAENCLSHWRWTEKLYQVKTEKQ